MIGIAVHAEHEDARAADRAARMRRISGRPPSPLPCIAEIDDDDVRAVAAVEPVAGGGIAGLEHGCDAGVLQHAPATLQHDRVIVDDEDAGHACAPSPASATSDGALRCSSRGMVIRTQVPPPVALST